MNGKYTLHVSYDAGSSYDVESHAEAPDLFKPRLKELDDAGWRWHLTDPAGDMCQDYICLIHAGIIAHLRQIR